MAGVAPATLLDPTVLAGIGDLQLIARTVVDGFVHGNHRSRRAGLSLEFAQHREYQPGDDVRRIDWRLHARTDRYYVKTYEAETNSDVMVVLDVSRSMDFGAGALTKFGWARCLAAALAWLAQRQGDRIGYLPVGGEGASPIPPGNRHLPLVLEAMARERPTGTVPLAEALDRAAFPATRQGICVVLSDCYDDPSRIARALGTLGARGHDVMLCHVIDPIERDFPYDAATTFADLERATRLAVNPAEIGPEYRARFAAHQAAVAAAVTAVGVDVVTVSDDEPLDRALTAWLEHRRRPEVRR